MKSIDEFEQFEETLAQYAPDCIVTVGYDHAVSRGAEMVRDMLLKRFIGQVITFDVEFRETWKGIFAAHLWLDGPKDSYLGYWRRGGGAGCEHSHALHLWLYFAQVLGMETTEAIDAQVLFDMKNDGVVEYDQIVFFNMRTENGIIGRVVQDVVTDPPKKTVRFQGTIGFIEWNISGSPDGDIIRYGAGDVIQVMKIQKTRRDDFHEEMLHYDQLLRGEIMPQKSPLSLTLGVEVMRILCEAYSMVAEMEEA